MSLFSLWVKLVKLKPVLFNSLTGYGLCASSDVIAQYLENETQETSTRIRRVVSAGFIGAFFGGFVYPYAYARLDSIWKGTHVSAVLQKSVVEIATVGICVNSIGISARGLLVGRDKRDVLEHVVKEMPIVTLNDARVWLPYNMIAFGFIPRTIRPTTSLFMLGAWQTYISLKSNNYKSAQEDDEEELLAGGILPGTIIGTASH